MRLVEFGERFNGKLTATAGSASVAAGSAVGSAADSAAGSAAASSANLALWFFLRRAGILTSGCLAGRGSSLLLYFGLLLLLTEARDRSEDRCSLAGSTAALACLLLLLLFLLLLFSFSAVLSLRLSLILSLGLGLGFSRLLWGRGSSNGKDRLAQNAMALLVGLALGNRWSQFLGLSRFFLQGSNPVITLGGVGSLEGVLVASDGEGEDDGAFGLDVGSFRLEPKRQNSCDFTP
jgi:hypothetical protein